MCSSDLKPFRHNEHSLRVVDVIEYEGRGLNLTWEVRDGILNHTGETLPATLEAQIVRVADRVAYINHDIDDAVRGGIIQESDLPPGAVKFFGRHHGLRISAMVKDMIAASADLSMIRMSEDGWCYLNELRDFLFDRVYTDSVAKTEDAKAELVVRSLFDYFYTHPDQMTAEFRPAPGDNVAEKVVDYVAGMTDRFAIKTYQTLFIPKAWMV